MRRKKLFYNTVTSFIYQFIVIICGFILPRVILQSFGSEVNGLTNSISQFLSIVTLLEFGVGAAASASLYKPLADREWEKISSILYSMSKFLKNLSKILAVYVIILIFVFPSFNSSGFDFMYTSSLLLIISANTFSQYYIGLTDTILLNADQKSYINYLSQSIAHILNTIMCVLLIKYGGGIHIVKFVTAIIYIVRPLIIRIYIKRYYSIDRQYNKETEPIKQRWNAFAQHLSECILNSTDTVVLTVFSTLTDVSIYSVYNLVVYNLKQFFISSTSGILSLQGHLWANNEKDKLRILFDETEWIIHTVIIYVFGCTTILLTPFVSIFTLGITDANYNQPLFGVLITLAHALHCFRLPYFTLIRAVGHFKETQNYFIISTILNLVVSCVLVKIYGLVGVAIGTLIGMFIQTLCLALYCYRHILKINLNTLYKRFFVNLISYFIVIPILLLNQSNVSNYYSWIFLAIKIALMYGICILIINMLFYKNKMYSFIIKIIK